MRGGWWALVGGVVTALVIGALQRQYPDVSFVAILGVGIACGAVISLAMFATSKMRNAGKQQ